MNELLHLAASGYTIYEAADILKVPLRRIRYMTDRLRDQGHQIRWLHKYEADSPRGVEAIIKLSETEKSTYIISRKVGRDRLFVIRILRLNGKQP